jgi:hypothetical protein
MTVAGSEEDIKRFQEEEFIHNGEPIPEWALKILHKGKEGLMFRLWSRWQPDFTWLEGLLDKYPSIWVKNIWDEEGGDEGVWVGTKRSGEKKIDRMEWFGMCIEEKAHRFRTSAAESS